MRGAEQQAKGQAIMCNRTRSCGLILESLVNLFSACTITITQYLITRCSSIERLEPEPQLPTTKHTQVPGTQLALATLTLIEFFSEILVPTSWDWYGTELKRRCKGFKGRGPEAAVVRRAANGSIILKVYLC